MSEWHNSSAASGSWQNNGKAMERNSDSSYSFPSASLSTNPCDNTTTSPYQYPDYNPSATLNTTPAFPAENSRISGDSKVTFSTLGWPLNVLLDNYRFVVRKGGEPYFELLPQSYPSEGVPGKVYLDPPRNPETKVFPCLYPGTCDGTTFKRLHDLERHYKNVHAPKDENELPCDYNICTRAREPFYRKDHFRDHLRDYHKEDIGSAKGEKSMKTKEWLSVQKDWLAERKIETKWWRCPKCLCRVQIAKWEYKCPACKTSCEVERRKRIEAERQKHNISGSLGNAATGVSVDGVDYLAMCAACNGTGYVMNMTTGTYDACPSCIPKVEAYDYEMGDAWEQPSGYSQYNTY